MLHPRNYNLQVESKCRNSQIKLLRNQVFDLSMKRKKIMMKTKTNRIDMNEMQEISSKIQKLNNEIYIMEIEDSVCESDFYIIEDSKEYDS